MASRTTASVGLGVTVTLLGVIAVGAIITSIVFFGQKQRAQTDLEQALDTQRDILTTQQRNSDRIQQRIQAARAEGQTLVAYLDESMRTVMDRVTGSPTDSAQRLVELLGDERYEGAEVNDLLTVVENRNREINRLEHAVADREAALEQARADLQQQVALTQSLRERNDEAIEQLRGELSTYSGNVSQYRGDMNQLIDRNNQRVDETRRRAAEQEAAMQETIASLENDILVLEGQLATLRQEVEDDRLRPVDEYALVDGRIAEINPTDDTVSLNVGRRDRVTLGLTFEVYADGTNIRPSESGNYPPGKGAVEIIRIDDASSIARIIRSNARNPIVPGDVIANALYDPDKNYNFVVFGLFDMDNDGEATAQEAGDIRTLIRSWGGTVNDDLSGRTDFLVLGERPVLPIEPTQDAPLPVIQNYIDKRRDAERYDRLFERATQASIPVLNQNRLITLTGLRGRR